MTVHFALVGWTPSRWLASQGERLLTGGRASAVLACNEVSAGPDDLVHVAVGGRTAHAASTIDEFGGKARGMGRWFRGPWTRQDGSCGHIVVPDEEGPWHEAVARTARLHGAMPYVVEGFMEVTEAVRRGHPVVVRKERAEVSAGQVVFADATGLDEAVVTITRFDLGTARFVVQDPESPIGAVQLTPKRLQAYLAEADRSVGVALGG